MFNYASKLAARSALVAGGQLLPLLHVLSRFAAAHKPFILVPGVNHGQTSNGISRYERGDLHATVPYDKAVADLGMAVASFMTAQEAQEDAVKGDATAKLLHLVQQASDMIAPYLKATGGCRAAFAGTFTRPVPMLLLMPRLIVLIEHLL